MKSRARPQANRPAPAPSRAQTPRPAPSRGARLTVSSRALPRLRAGHPWLYREAVGQNPSLVTGDVVALYDEQAQLVGHGLYDQESALAVRVWSLGERVLDDALWRSRLDHAIRLREDLFDTTQTDAYRLVHGEGDRMPGIVIDRYGPIAVLKTDGAAVEPLLQRNLAHLSERLQPLGIHTLLRRQGERGARETVVVHGEAPSQPVAVREHGMPFEVDVLRGQKTGAFLDQRDNRRRVRERAAGKRVLNLFSYAGGFSLAAALGGAREVVSVDIAHGAHATARKSFTLAGVDPRAHQFVTADVFAYLEDASRRGERFDLVICDPPSFAPNAKSVPKALSAYRALHRACMGVLAPRGVFCAASCSSHVPADLFASTLDDQALGTDVLRMVESYGPPPDHPVSPAFPEGAYLKFVVLR